MILTRSTRTVSGYEAIERALADVGRQDELADGGGSGESAPSFYEIRAFVARSRAAEDSRRRDGRWLRRAGRFSFWRRGVLPG